MSKHFSSFVKVDNIMKFEAVREDYLKAAYMVSNLYELEDKFDRVAWVTQWKHFTEEQRFHWSENVDQAFRDKWNSEARKRGMRMLAAYLHVKDAVLPQDGGFTPAEARELEKLKSFLNHVEKMKSLGASRYFMANLKTGRSCLFENAFRRD